VRELENQCPEYLPKTVVVPHGASVLDLTSEQHRALRTRFQLPQEALIFASFGSLHPLKLNAETVRAFASVAKAYPSALLVFVGDESGGAAARAQVAALQLQERVRFLGRVPIDDFVNLAAAVDVGVSLRRPPSNGETSGGLLILLKAGVPTIVL